MELGSSHRYLGIGPGELAQAAAEGGATEGKALSQAGQPGVVLPSCCC